MKKKRFIVALFGVGFLAQLIYKCATGAITFLYEFFVIGLTFSQWGSVSVLYGIPCVLLGRYIELFTYRIRLFLRTGNSRAKKAFADIAVLILCYAPLYILAALLSGMNLKQTFYGVTFCIGQTVLFGPLYGIILDYIRNTKSRRRKRRVERMKLLEAA